MNKFFNGFLLLLFFLTFALAQNKPKSYLDMKWKEVATKMPDEWYASADAKMAADSILKYQTKAGGWPKNSDFHRGGMKQDEWKRIQESGIGATFDNSATTTEMMFLAKIYDQTKDERYRTAFLKGLNYIFEAQYENGGWPQFYPVRKGFTSYSGHITYNDGAMVNVMNFLKSIFENSNNSASLNIADALKLKAHAAFDKGIKCIVNTQIIVNGKPTVWCAQHDEITLKPANARAYELASFSGAESVGITQLLMEVDNPTKEIINAVNGAVKWFEENKIEGIKLSTITNSDRLSDKLVVEDKNAPAIWARFYDLETGKPYFCDRDGIKRKTFAEMGYNRRNGYSWYTYAPDKLLLTYPEWSKKWNK